MATHRYEVGEILVEVTTPDEVEGAMLSVDIHLHSHVDPDGSASRAILAAIGGPGAVELGAGYFTRKGEGLDVTVWPGGGDLPEESLRPSHPLLAEVYDAHES